MSKNEIAIIESGRVITTPDIATIIDSLLNNLDVSPNTQYDYRSRVPLFLNFIRSHGINLNTYLDFKRYLISRVDYCSGTKSKYLSVSKAILKEMYRLGYIPTDVTSTVKGFSQGNLHKRDGINEDEMAKLMAKVKRLPDTSESSRLKAILSLLVLQGLRQIELSRLDVSDLDLSANTALILGKGRSDKELIDLQPEATKALSQYLESNNIKSGSLFVSQSNNSKNKRLSTRSIRQLVKDVLNELEIKKTVHGARHYFTSQLIRAYKGDLLQVMSYTRHRSVETLQVYFDSIKKKEDLPRFYEAFNGVAF